MRQQYHACAIILVLFNIVDVIVGCTADRSPDVTDTRQKEYRPISNTNVINRSFSAERYQDADYFPVSSSDGVLDTRQGLTSLFEELRNTSDIQRQADVLNTMTAIREKDSVTVAAAGWIIARSHGPDRNVAIDAAIRILHNNCKSDFGAAGFCMRLMKEWSAYDIKLETWVCGVMSPHWDDQYVKTQMCDLLQNPKCSNADAIQITWYFAQRLQSKR